MTPNCICCGNDDGDLRAGICFDCADAGEARALKRTVLQHLCRAALNWRPQHWWRARIDLSWAWERLTATGDYAPATGAAYRR